MRKTRTTRTTSHTRAFRKTCPAAALAAATGTVLALDSGGIVRTAADDYSTTAPATAPANPAAPAQSGRMQGERDTQQPATPAMSSDKAKEKLSDSTITTKVKAKLLTTKDLKSTGIHVKTGDGVVNVSGNVPSKEQHDRALETIRSVKGVNSVHDTLKISSR